MIDKWTGWAVVFIAAILAAFLSAWTQSYLVYNIAWCVAGGCVLVALGHLVVETFRR